MQVLYFAFYLPCVKEFDLRKTAAFFLKNARV